MNVIKKITMKQLCIILTISMLPTLGFGQFIGDSVIVYIDNRVEVKVAIPDYADTKTVINAVAALTELERIIPEVADQLSSDSADLLKYSAGGSLTIEPGDPKIIYLTKDEKLSNTGFRDQAIISGENYTIFITMTDLSTVSELPISTCLEKVVAMLPEKTHWSKSLYFECINGNVSNLENKSNMPDFLELQLGVGAGLVKSTWVADLSICVLLGLNHKGMLRAPYVSSNVVFDFDAENKMNLNTFLNVGYQWNLNEKSEKPSNLGVELGYLIVQQGDLFGENTFKLGVNWSPAKSITVSPQLFITDNFDAAYPGVRIGFGF